MSSTLLWGGDSPHYHFPYPYLRKNRTRSKDLASAGGFVSGSSGFRLNEDESIDSSNAYWVLTWPAEGSQKAFTQTPSFKNLSISSTFPPNFPPVTTLSPPARHPYSKTSSAPVVEWARIVLCADTDKLVYRIAFANFEAELVKAEGKYVAHSVEFESERSEVLVVLYVLGGSFEAHNSWIAGDGKEVVERWIVPETEALEGTI